MRPKVTRGLLLGVLLMAVNPWVLACGDKLVGIGGGAPFARIHADHYLAQILFFARPDSVLRSFDRMAHLTDRLERSGHSVRVIDSDTALASALRDHRTDLVLAAPDDAASIRTHFANAHAAPAVLAVVQLSDHRAANAPLLTSCQLQMSYHQSRDAEAAIDSFISRRQAGAIPDCAASDERR